MYESKHTNLIFFAVVEIGTDRIVRGLYRYVQADNPEAVERVFRELMQRMPKDGHYELTVNYEVTEG